MKIAIISDIHANLEAFEAVLKDIRSKGISEIVCLGDVIGYGPNPRECLKTVIDTCKLCLRGNHEEAVLYFSYDFQVDAAQAVDWTREELNSNRYDAVENSIFWDYLGELVRLEERDDILYLHGAPREPTREYLRPIDIADEEKMRDNFGLIRQYCFCGHTHEPGVLVMNPNGKVRFLTPADLTNNYVLDVHKCIVNVGSVGQPRDGDNRACYVVLEDRRISFQRLPYDYKTTMRKILETKLLPKVFAARLQVGR